jgi:DegV family protein with EDD domain
MAIKIVTDSTADLPQSIIDQYGIIVVPLKVIFGDELLVDGVDIDGPRFYEKLKQSEQLPTTSQVNPNEFYPVFKEIIDNGDEVLGIFISTDLSGTGQSAYIAQKELESDKIHIVDSRTVTFELGFLVTRAAQMVEAGKDILTIVEAIKTLKENSQLYAIIDTLEYLIKGGRLKATSGAIGTALKLKPIITIENGLVKSISKQRGRKKALQWIKSEMQRKGQTLDGKIVFVGHSYDPKVMGEFKQWIKSEWTPQEIIETHIGPIVGVHAGPGCVGMIVVDE